MPDQILYVESLTTKVTKLRGRAFGKWWGLSIKFLCGFFESPASRVISGETQNFTRWAFIWGNGLLGDVSLKDVFLSPILTTLWVHTKVNKISLSIVLPSSDLPHERPRNREPNDHELNSLNPWAQINHSSPRLWPHNEAALITTGSHLFMKQGHHVRGPLYEAPQKAHLPLLPHEDTVGRHDLETNKQDLIRHQIH